MPELADRDRWLLRLATTPGLGERGLAHLLASGIPLPRLFRLPEEELRGRFGLTPRAAAALLSPPEGHAYRLAALERTVAQFGIRLLTPGGAGYPPGLAERGGEDAPALLFAYGNVELAGAPTLSLLCSGGESRAALERVSSLAGEWAAGGGAIVAGHNRPAYRAALAAAKAAGGGRVIVLDRGLLDAFGGDLDRDLFPTARVWGYSFDRDRALALSPYPPDARYVGLRNRQRDRLVALLSGRIVAVEIRAGGVMESECRAARGRGTPVFVCRGVEASEGNHRLLAEGLSPMPESVAALR